MSQHAWQKTRNRIRQDLIMFSNSHIAARIGKKGTNSSKLAA
jgi:hypothetical protein